ncbi:hypothetical protein [Rhodococcus sp. SORGH_AS_0301]|uniref:hypothetical protein n=1 Tax=Rhodococcus sp. SORGH_AS_0301 TaxID=3041780 RepID=UPI00358E76F8
MPSPGRLGLVEASAPANLSLLGWTDEDSTELLWSLSRSPDADLALRTLARLAEDLGDNWSDLDAPPAHRQESARPHVRSRRIVQRSR